MVHFVGIDHRYLSPVRGKQPGGKMHPGLLQQLLEYSKDALARFHGQ